MNGIVSMKSDVYSFGVLVLEIISSKKNNGSYDTERPLNLVGYVSNKKSPVYLIKNRARLVYLRKTFPCFRPGNYGMKAKLWS